LDKTSHIINQFKCGKQCIKIQTIKPD